MRIAPRLFPLLSAGALPLAVLLGGCAQADEEDKGVADIVASLKTCGDYAEMRAQANCTRFVEQERDPASAFGKTSNNLVKALQKRWDGECVAKLGEIRTLEMKTTIGLTTSGAVKGKEDSISICAAQVAQEFKAFPALAADRTAKQ